MEHELGDVHGGWPKEVYDNYVLGVLVVPEGKGADVVVVLNGGRPHGCGEGCGWALFDGLESEGGAEGQEVVVEVEIDVGVPEHVDGERVNCCVLAVHWGGEKS